MKAFIYGPLCSALLMASVAHASSRGRVTGVANLNDASIEQLRRLPGVSEKLAERIIEYRHLHRFAKVEDLAKVEGFNQTKVKRLKSHLRVAGDSTIQLEKKTGNSRSRNSHGRSHNSRSGQHGAQGRSTKHPKPHTADRNPHDKADEPSGDLQKHETSVGKQHPSHGSTAKPVHQSPVPSVKETRSKAVPSARNHPRNGHSAQKQLRTHNHRKRPTYTRHSARGTAKRTHHVRG